ncbi:MAG: hypothetical protein Q9228_004573, partial [Teloschistes exilis]
MGKKRKQLSHEEIWDDSALLDSWEAALQEYQLYHSIHARGERVEDVLKQAEASEEDSNHIHGDLDHSLNQLPSEPANGLPLSEDLEDGEVGDDQMEDRPPVDASITEEFMNIEVLGAPGEPPAPTTKSNIQSTSLLPEIPPFLTDVDQDLKNVMISWYYAGYYTGFTIVLFIVLIPAIFQLLFSPYIYSTRRLGDVNQLGQRSVGQLPQQISRRIEIPFGTGNFSYDFSKRALDYEKYELKGRDVLQMIECQSPSTAGWTMANLNNGWYIEHYEEVGVDRELVPPLKGLGIPYDEDHLLSKAPTQNEEFTDAQGNPNNPPTDAYYDTILILNGNAIIAENNLSPPFAKPGSPIPPLWRWSDIVFLLWRDEAKDQAGKLKYIIRNDIVTPVTRAVMEYIAGSQPDSLDRPWPDTPNPYSPASREGRMLLGTPHGIGVAHMIADYNDVLGKKQPWVHVYTAKNTDPTSMHLRKWKYYMVWTMGDLNNGWTVKNQEGKEPSLEVTPALKGLGIPYDGNNVEGRESTQDQPLTDKNGNPNQPATKGFYVTSFLVNGGTIIAENNRSPVHQAPGAAVPPLWRWSDITWLLWTTIAASDTKRGHGARAAGLRYIIQDNVITEITRYLIEYIEVTQPPDHDLDLPWPACIASAFATYDSSYGGNMGGSMMNSGASDKNAMDKSGSMMNEGANQKNAMDMSSGSSSATVDISVTVISSYKGGNAPMEQISQPTMAKGMTHMVTVGGDAGLVFSPSSINAAPGDMVHFTFMSQNHTLTQSTFPKPCVKMQGGVDSGFLPNPNNTISPPPTYMFQVKDMKPSWFYCKQKKPAVHCGKGMTFSINPTADKTQDMFMQMAMQQN